MSLKIVQSAEALRDVINIAGDISGISSLNASDRFLEATKQAFRQLAEMPGIGVSRDYGNPAFAGMRMWHVPRYRKFLIFYRTTETELEIIRVLHGAQNIQQIFAPSSDE
jgi:toxin ParE1/3/4